jgi:CBS domain-containing protein
MEKKVKELLAQREDSLVVSVNPTDTVLSAARVMNERRIGAVVVTDGSRVVGIFSERDILRRVVAMRLNPEAVSIKDVMTSPCIVVTPDATLEQCEVIITDKRVRHLPVVDEGRLVGMVTAGDIMAQAVVSHQVQIDYLQSYIYGR